MSSRVLVDPRIGSSLNDFLPNLVTFQAESTTRNSVGDSEVSHAITSDVGWTDVAGLVALPCRMGIAAISSTGGRSGEVRDVQEYQRDKWRLAIPGDHMADLSTSMRAKVLDRAGNTVARIDVQNIESGGGAAFTGDDSFGGSRWTFVDGEVVT